MGRFRVALSSVPTDELMHRVECPHCHRAALIDGGIGRCQSCGRALLGGRSERGRLARISAGALAEARRIAARAKQRPAGRQGAPR